jgi:asparagine synthase (glutamine-hydrolysing)
VRVTLRENFGFKWRVRDRVSVKGYFFLDNTMYVGDSAVEYFSTTKSFGDFRKKISELNGSFAVVICNDGEVFAAVDRLRSIPLFYSTSTNMLSDTGIAMLSENPLARIDEAAVADFRLAGYSVGSRTLIEGTHQLQAGEMLCHSAGACRVETYFRHSHGEYRHEDEQSCFDELDQITSRVFKRLIATCAGREIAVPLSGGYDSRYIAASLKALGANNVVCFSYGKKDSFEVAISRKIAEQLGFAWHFVEYTDEKWRDCLLDTAFVEFASNLTSLPNIQDYVALQELRDRKTISPGAIVVPGYCGDLLGGSYVPYELLIDRPSKLLEEGLPTYISRTHFGLDDETERCADIRSRIQDEIYPYSSVDNQEEFVGRNEEFFTRHKVAKYVVNAVRSIEYFGHEWRMPLWDNELAEFFYRLPVAQRKDSRMYERYLGTRVFGPSGIDFRKATESDLKRAFKRRCPDFLYDAFAGSYQMAMKYLRNSASVDINRFSGFIRLCLDDIGPDKPVSRNDVISVYAAWYLDRFLSEKLNTDR